ncbi:hypothetical protein AVT69_gp317 [Pseudomonas phage PhiPA3]|uniref:Uncharacterized protein 319 n=1 Tax=Pseudomonas phage PhiPA3 TaxID=998086 RepID=F8SJF5_BPPA3|nr:hypothetical protein AVT69_gp317 [Pseudomonas phage PhiPA3]AEH03742.1 hypothetical protein [Pseudomonas phage PhiPA3]
MQLQSKAIFGGARQIDLDPVLMMSERNVLAVRCLVASKLGHEARAFYQVNTKGYPFIEVWGGDKDKRDEFEAELRKVFH